MKKLSFFFLLILLTTKLNAQVNLQTGSAVFSLPMFNWQDDKSRLNSAISLEYSSGKGLMVNEIASNIGQGWNLLAGGSITRVQVGQPDDQKPFPNNDINGTINNNIDGAINNPQKYPAGYLYSGINALQGCPIGLARYPIFKGKDQLYVQNNPVAADRELDYFSFQFGGHTGLFILNKNGNGNTSGDVGIPLDDSKIKIWFTRNESMPNIRTTINAFYVQDENGLIYKFQQLSLSKIQTSQYCDKTFTKVQNQPTFSGGGVYYQNTFDLGNLVNPWMVDSWSLSEIDDPLTNRKITFSYAVENINAYSGAGISYDAATGYVVISKKSTISQTSVLSAINYPDGHTVTMNYGAPRSDLNGDNVLSSVDISYQGRYVSKYALNTNYFILNRLGTPVSPQEQSEARLCLQSVIKYGPDLKEDNPPYTFNYYTGSNANDNFVPPPYCPSKDIWGFYNGNSCQSDDGTSIPLNTPLTSLSFTQLKGLCFLYQSSSSQPLSTNYSTVNSGYAQNGLLKAIVYPTGGTLTYMYGQNVSQLNNNANAVVGGVHVVSTSTTDGGYQYDCGKSPLTIHYNYVSSSNNSSLWGYENPVNYLSDTSFYQAELRKLQYHFLFKFSCYWYYQYPGIIQQTDAVPLSTLQSIMQAIAPVLSIISGVNQIVGIIDVIGGTSPVGLIIAVVAAVIDVIISCTSSAPSQLSPDVIYYSDNVNGSNPLPEQYNRVEVVKGDGGGGKVVSEFTDPSDYPIWIPNNNALSKQQRYAYWAYGLPKEEDVYDESGNLVKQTLNNYDTTFALQNEFRNTAGNAIYSTEHGSCACLVTNSHSQRSSDWYNPSDYLAIGSFTKQNISGLQAQLYDINFGRMQLSSTKERTYKQGSNSSYLEKTTTYSYDILNHQPSFVTHSESDGLTKETGYTYSCDYSGSNAGILSTLVQNNALSIPVSQNSFSLDRASNIFFLLNQKITEYSTTPIGDIEPIRDLEQRFTQPTYNVPLYGGPGSASNPQYIQTAAYTYDNNGNLVGNKDEGSRVVTNIYDYNNEFIVASIINADPVQDPSYYTSFETGSMGGWLLSGTPSFVTTQFVTGNQSVSMAGITLSANALNLTKGYRLSFWSTSTGISVNAGTLVKSAPTINGFTYYEYSIPQGTANLTVSGTGYIDELRLYPQSARMHTTTYDPVIGKTSECDDNDRTTYYTYDNLARLRFVKDEFGSVIKMYEYNNVSNPICPIVYTNNAITEQFTKSNCTTGHVGGGVTYTIPAGKYSSNISQADADAQAENELDANAQANADNNGACLPIYYSAATSKLDTTQCSDGDTGNVITYTVPAGAYTSIISQADADAQAQFDANSNSQMYANANGVCSVNSDPDWEQDADSTQITCQTDANGNFTGHYLAYFTDENPNSPTYNQQQLIDVGPNLPDGLTAPNCTSSSTILYAGPVTVLYTDGTGEWYEDMGINFFSSANPTVSLAESNIIVNYYEQMDCDGQAPVLVNSWTSTVTTLAGEYTIVQSGIPVGTMNPEANPPPTCVPFFGVSPGTGYTPSNQ